MGCNFNESVKANLTDKMMSEQSLKEIKRLAKQITEGRVFCRVGTATAKAQRWRHV